MANLGFNFNAGDHKPLDSREPIPVAWYPAVIIESEVKPTQAAGGEILNLTFMVIDGEYEGRRVWDRCNLKNANPKAVEIGMRQLTSICNAVGKGRVSDSAELHDAPLMIRTKIVPAGPDKNGVYREAKNEISDYLSMDAFAAREKNRTGPRQGATTPSSAYAASNAAASGNGNGSGAATATVAAPARKPWERR